MILHDVQDQSDYDFNDTTCIVNVEITLKYTIHIELDLLTSNGLLLKVIIMILMKPYVLSM